MYRKDMRPEIVDSFVEEYNLHGPKLTLDSVSARIHISKKTIYRFFRSKDDIYSFILADMKEEFAAKREAVLANYQLSCGEKIEGILTAKTQWEERLDFKKAHLLALDSPAVFEEAVAIVDAACSDIKKELEKGIEEGAFLSSIHVDLTIGCLRSAILYLLQTPILDQDNMGYDEAMKSLAQTLLRGIAR